ncbi:thioredoxin family protein [Halopseudomonas xiamenensis]|uniref:thioredoxin family protein n=1 Tax=Halopseudomonas xiamenensis TaxID=157792 RepID=UPI001C8A6A7D|nr:thioredoxin family protein [Halopseudomonas xiamenensis]
MQKVYTDQAPSRDEVDALQGTTVIEFGTDWCGHCQAAQPHLEKAFDEHPQLRHLKIEDGPGRPLGRSFRVKLWPTLIFMRDGEEVERLVRPVELQPIRDAMNRLAGQGSRPGHGPS